MAMLREAYKLALRRANHGSTLPRVLRPSGRTGSASHVTSLVVIPVAQSVASPSTLPQEQFLAIGTKASGATINLADRVTWSSSSTQIATIDATGSATAKGQEMATITALY